MRKGLLKPRRSASRVRRHDPPRYFCEPLERRTLLVGNLDMVDAALSDSDGNTFASVAAGQRFVYMRIDYQTTDLAANASYMVQVSFGGEQFFYLLNAGAGQAGTNPQVLIAGPWTKGAGNQAGAVLLDSANFINETNEGDNADGFNANGVVPSFKFAQPLEGTPWVDWNITNYVDLDASDGIEDYHGGTFAYDGHNGWDIHMANFRQTDGGWEVYAAADGIVSDAHDGEFDRQVEKDMGDSNYVVIDHGGGWVTKYFHLRRDSVNVVTNDPVDKGDLIGLVASSGNSTGPHLHFGVYYNDNLVEPNVAAASYFTVPIGYSGDHPTVLDAVVTNHNPSSAEQKEGPYFASTFLQGETVTYSISLGGIEFGDTLEFVWYRPDLTVAFNPSDIMNELQGGWWDTNFNLPGAAPAGTWQVATEINGVEKSRHSFTVGSTGAPQVSMWLGSDYVIDNRWTPFDFGTLVQGEIGGLSQMTFTVQNSGHTTLNLSGLTVPTGFQIIDGLPATLAAGASNSFTIVLDPYAAAIGHKIGTVSFNTNDTGPGESVMSFRIEGTLNQLTGIQLSDDPDTVYIRRLGDDTEIFINKPPGPLPDYDIPFAGIGHLNFYTYGGNDTLTVDFTGGMPLSDDGIDYYGSAHTDTLIIYGDSRGESATLRHFQVVWSNIPIGFNDVERIKLYGNAGGEDINIGDGALNVLPDDLTIVGGLGNDSIEFDHTNQTNPTVYGIEDELFTTGDLIAHYTEMEFLHVMGGGSDDSFITESTALGTEVSLSGNGGDDYFHVTPFNGHLEYVKDLLTINGGNGQDSVAVHDSDHINGEVFDITSNSIVSSRPGFIPNFFQMDYSSIQQVIINGGSGADVFNIQSTSTTFFINAGQGNDWFFLTPNSRDLSDILGNLSLFGEEDDDRLIINDDDFVTAGTVFGQFTTNSFDTSHSELVTFGTLESIVYNSSDSETATTVVSLPTALALTLNGGASEDIFVIADQINGLALLATSGNIEVDGGASKDTLLFNDESSTENNTYTLSSAYFISSVMAAFVHFLDIQSIDLNAGDGHNIIAVGSLVAPLTIDANDGDDTIFLGSIGGLLDPITEAITVNGNAGADTVLLNDSTQPVGRTHTITSTTYARTVFPIITYGTLEFLRLFAGSGADVINVNSTAAGTPVFINAGGGIDGIRVNETDATAPVTIHPTAGNDNVNVNTDGAGAATAIFSATQSLGMLSIGGGGVALLPAGADKVLTIVDLSITGTGRLDLADNDMIWDYVGATPFATAQLLLANGYAGGAWNGNGIFTSMGNAATFALGFAEASDVAPDGKFSGQPFAGDALLFKYTYYGDANLDGMTEINDLYRFGINFGLAGSWAQGNFNYSGGVIDAVDLGLLSANWQSGVGSPLALVVTSLSRRAPTRAARLVL